MSAPGVHRVSTVESGGNAFVVDGDEGVVLVDTGLPRRHDRILDVLASIGRTIEDVHSVLVTHAHVDHIGGLAALTETGAATVYASPLDAPVVRGEGRPSPPPLFDRLGVLGQVLSRLIPVPPPARVDVEVGTSPLPSDMTAIPTPGHTAGHVSYLLDRGRGVLFVGDAARQRHGVIVRGFFNKADPVIDASIRRLAEHPFEIACFGHSPTLLRGARGAFAAF